MCGFHHHIAGLKDRRVKRPFCARCTARCMSNSSMAVNGVHLVIGTDRLHSRVRKLVFGPQDRYKKELGYGVAAFENGRYMNSDLPLDRSTIFLPGFAPKRLMTLIRHARQCRD